MIFRLHRENGARNSVPVFDALEQGIRRLGHDTANQHDTADIAVIWSQLWHGRMRANQEIWQHHVRTKRPLWIVEVGVLDRDRLWRITPVAATATARSRPGYQRASRLGVHLLPWHNRGSDIMIALQNTRSQQWHNQPDVATWLRGVVHEVRKHSTRAIVVRPHPRCRFMMPQELVDQGCTLQLPRALAGSYDDYDFDLQMQQTWAVINWNSHPGVRAVINGVPAFVGPNSMAAEVGNLDLAGIEQPHRPDRQAWLENLSWQEWTLAELADGTAVQHVLDQWSR